MQPRKNSNRLQTHRLKGKRFFDSYMKLNLFGLAGSMIHTMHYKVKTEQLNITVNLLEKMSWNKLLQCSLFKPLKIFYQR